MSDNETSPNENAKVVKLARRQQSEVDTDQRHEKPTDGEIILLNEGLDLLAAFKRISDPRTRTLVRALVDGLAEAASEKET